MHQAICIFAARALLVLMPTSTAGLGSSTPDAIVAQAMLILSQPMNDVRVLSAPQVRELYLRVASTVPPAGLNAFRIRGDSTIYLNAESTVYRDATRKPTAFHILRVASTLLHEQVHDTDGEYAAYRRQSDFVRSRLQQISRADRDDADRYWRRLETRASSLGLIERKLRH